MKSHWKTHKGENTQECEDGVEEMSRKNKYTGNLERFCDRKLMYKINQAYVQLIFLKKKTKILRHAEILHKSMNMRIH